MASLAPTCDHPGQGHAPHRRHALGLMARPAALLISRPQAPPRRRDPHSSHRAVPSGKRAQACSSTGGSAQTLLPDAGGPQTTEEVQGAGEEGRGPGQAGG